MHCVVAALIYIRQYLEDAGVLGEVSSPIALLDSMKKAVAGKSAAELTDKIDSCARNIRGLRELYTNAANRDESTKKKVNEVVELAIFRFYISEGAHCNMVAKYKIKDDEIEVSKAQLLELRR
jgi:hypothetical protein